MPTTSPIKSTPSSHDVSSARLIDEGACARTTTKDVRAHEHARHRTKERQEHALTKERKEKATAIRMLGFKVARGAKPVRKLTMESWDGQMPEDPAPALTTPAHDGRKQEQEQPSPPRDSTSSSTFMELTLGDVISQPRRLKAKQFDFEVIPRVRAVIALDDVDVDTDDQWEYVTRASLNDGLAWKGKSYAQAVSSAM